MQGKHLYEYAVIRLVPKVEREEFFNVGIILFSKRAKYIKALYKVDENKLNLFSSELDRESLFANLHVSINLFRYEGGRSYRCSGRPGTVSLADSSAECIYPDFTSASGLLRRLGPDVGDTV